MNEEHNAFSEAATPHCFVEPEWIDIESVVYPGRGMGRLSDGRRVFVPRALAGERADVEIVAQHRSYADAVARSITDHNPGRIEPDCAHYGGSTHCASGCGGCAYRHVVYREEVALKQAQLVEILRRQAGLTSVRMAEPVAAPKPNAYRSKIALHVENGSRGMEWGFVSLGGRTISPIDCCELAAEPINERLAVLRNDAAFWSSLSAGDKVFFRYTPKSGVRYWREGEAERHDAEDLVEDTPLGPLLAPERSFFQVNPAVASCLVEYALEWVGRVRPARVIDVYCGIGIFSIAARRGGAGEVLGIDQDRRGIAVARRNASALGVDGQVAFWAEPSEVGLPRALRAVSSRGLAVVVDPPREGMGKAVVSAIARHRPEHVLYVSCDPATLARDLKALVHERYAVESIRLFDMFPRTGHFETVTALRAN